MLHSYGYGQYQTFGLWLGGACAIAAVCLIVAIVVALFMATPKRD